MASCNILGVILAFLLSLVAFPANSSSSAVRYSRTAAMKTLVYLDTRMSIFALFIWRLMRPTGKTSPALLDELRERDGATILPFFAPLLTLVVGTGLRVLVGLLVAGVDTGKSLAGELLGAGPPKSEVSEDPRGGADDPKSEDPARGEGLPIPPNGTGPPKRDPGGAEDPKSEDPKIPPDAEGRGGLGSNREEGIRAAASLILAVLNPSLPVLSRVSSTVKEGNMLNTLSRQLFSSSTGFLIRSSCSKLRMLVSAFKSSVDPTLLPPSIMVCRWRQGRKCTSWSPVIWFMTRSSRIREGKAGNPLREVSPQSLKVSICSWEQRSSSAVSSGVKLPNLTEMSSRTNTSRGLRPQVCFLTAQIALVMGIQRWMVCGIFEILDLLMQIQKYIQKEIGFQIVFRELKGSAHRFCGYRGTKYIYIACISRQYFQMALFSFLNLVYQQWQQHLSRRLGHLNMDEVLSYLQYLIPQIKIIKPDHLQQSMQSQNPRPVPFKLSDIDFVRTETFRIDDYNRNDFSLNGAIRQQQFSQSPIRDSHPSSSYNNSFSFPIHTVDLQHKPLFQAHFPAPNPVPMVNATGYQDIRSGLQRIKHTQMEVLQELRNESALTSKSNDIVRDYLNIGQNNNNNNTQNNIPKSIPASQNPSHNTSILLNQNNPQPIIPAVGSGLPIGMPLNTNYISNVSQQESLSQSLQFRQFDKYDNKIRESELLQQKRKLEGELNQKMKKIEEMLLHERELQKTIHNMKLEMDKNNEEDYENIVATLKQDQNTIIERYQRELSLSQAESDRLLSQNTKLKKELLAKESQLLKMASNSNNSNDSSNNVSKTMQEESVIRMKQEELKKLIAVIQETMAAKDQEYQRIMTIRGIQMTENEKLGLERLANNYTRQKLDLERISQQTIFTDLTADHLISLKQQIIRLNQLKEKEIQQIKTNKSNYEYLQTESAYQSVYFDLVTELENLKHRKVLQTASYRNSLNVGGLLNMPNPIESKYTSVLIKNQVLLGNNSSQTLISPFGTNTELEKCRARISELEEQIQSLREYIENENIDKSRFLQELEKSNLASKQVYKENEDLKKQIDGLRAEFSFNKSQSVQIENLKPVMDARVRELQVLILDQVKDITKYKSEISELSLRLEGFKSQANGLRLEKELLERQLADKNKYCDELEEALAPIKPKHPFPLIKTWDEKEIEMTEKIGELEKQMAQMVYDLTVQKQNSAEEIMNKQNSWGLERRGLEEKVREINDEKERLHNQIAQLKAELQRSSSKVEELEAVTESLNTEITLKEKKLRELESANSQHSLNYGELAKQKTALQLQFQEQVSRLIGLTNQNETKIKQSYESELEKTRSKLEEEKRQYFALVKELTHDKQRLLEQCQTIERERSTKEVEAEREIAKLTAQNTTLKESLQQQLDKMSKTNAEHTKAFMEKYQRDVKQLQTMNQQLTQENRNLLGLQVQNSQQALVIRQLQNEVKQKSSAVEHLWEVKKVEFENIMRQLGKMKSMTRALMPESRKGPVMRPS